MQAYAKKGIIISAGNFSSVILQRSGIGRTDDLSKAGISTLIESPNVGHNFKTQYACSMGIEVETQRLLDVLSADPMPLLMGAFKKESGPSRRLQLIGLPVPSLLPIQDIFINNWIFYATKSTNVMSIALVDLTPKSTGTISVAHSDPEAYPSIQFNPLDNIDDLNFMIDNYIKAYNIFVEARKLDPDGVYKLIYPSEEIFNLSNEEQKRNALADFVRASYNPFDHYGGQCKMARTIEDGVVDGFLNVFGTENLKVADLSISPILPDGNTALGAQMIGLNSLKGVTK